jgi:hypothetical protein
MAGDWIKMRVDLADDPAVIAMAVQLQVSELLIVGALHKLWSWADRHTVDGHAKSVTMSWINRYIMLPGFAEAMLSTGWLEQKEDGIAIPHFDRHNGETGKKRAESTRRQQKYRNSSSQFSHKNSVTNASPEKRREDISTTPIKSASQKPDHWTNSQKGMTEKAKELGIDIEGLSSVLAKVEIENAITLRNVERRQ